MSKKDRRSFLKLSFLALIASTFGVAAKAIEAQIKAVKVKAVLISQKFRNIPKTAETIDKSATLHVSAIHLRSGSIRTGEATIRKGLTEFQKEPGVSKVAVYKLVSGSPGAPTHIFAFIGKNPKATRGLANKSKYRSIQNSLTRMTFKPIKNLGTNAKFVGKVG